MSFFRSNSTVRPQRDMNLSKLTSMSGIFILLYFKNLESRSGLNFFQALISQLLKLCV